MKDYDPKEIEPKWQEKWQKDETYKTPDTAKGKENEYVLVEFAYPSGNLHAGHWYAFSVPDIYARYRRMTGKNVLYPMGFDAFGLPAENAAIKNKLNPREWTFGNIEYMRKQLHSMGASFDWSREVITASPEYYKWTQWLFLQLFNKGLAYRKDTPVNWCPKDKTVLANEQVVDGKCERCGTEVEKRDMLQWNLKITDYADRLVDDLEALDWPRPIKDAQKNWIGRSEGVLIKFAGDNNSIEVFTTRPDTIFGATFIAVAPEVAKKLTGKDFGIKTDTERENKEKIGVDTGLKVKNPANGEEIPVWVVNYVSADYGTGAIMGVPAHDERDSEFSKKYELPIKQVIAPCFEYDGDYAMRDGAETLNRRVVEAIIENDKGEFLLIKETQNGVISNHFVGGGTDEEDDITALKREVIEETGYTDLEIIGQVCIDIYASGFRHTKNKNQITVGPAFHVKLKSDKKVKSEAEEGKHSILWVKKNEVAKLISMWPAHSYMWESFLNSPPTYTGGGVLINSDKFDQKKSEEVKKEITEFVGGKWVTKYKLRDWVVSRQRYWGCPIPVVHCEKCGIVPVPEKDLPVILPEVEDYLPRDDGQSPLAKAEAWVNVECQKCGAMAKRDTDTLDTFVDSSWYFLRYADPKNDKEFASKDKLNSWMPVDFYSGGAEHTTMHLLYSRFFHKALFDLGLVNEDEPYKRRMNRGLILGPDGHKMSKSKGNVIDPDDYVKRLGADTVRTYLAFIGPYNEVGSYPWNPDSIIGVRRFLERVWKMSQNLSSTKSSKDLDQAIKKVGESIEMMKMNTAVPVLMSFMNEAEKSGITKDQYEIFLKLLAPFAPHITDELWESLGHKDSIHTEEWPKYDEAKLEKSESTYAIQINGKVRGTLLVDKSTTRDELEKRALDMPEIAKWLEGKEVKKVIVVPQKVVNVVTT